MAITTHPATGPAGVLARASAQIAGLAEVLWAARTDEEVVGTVEQIETLRAQLAGLEARAVVEADTRGVAKRGLGYASTADWLVHRGGRYRREGRRTVAHAHDLLGDRAATLAALDAGRVSPQQAGIILDAVDKLPTDDPGLRRQAEELLLAEADRLDATDLAKAAKHLVAVVDPDGEERRQQRNLDREDRAAHRNRGLSIVEDGAGGIRIKGSGSVEDGAALKAALLPLTTPHPADPDASEAEAAAGCDGKDPRDHGTRLWDALIGLAQQSLTTEVAPECHGARPRVTVTTDLETLKGGLGWGQTDEGLELTGSAVRRLACDAEIIPVVLGSRSEVLDVGRLQRLVTAAIWRALVARDGRCAFPGCTRPPVMCHAHHVQHWADGGPTSLANLVLLCGHHHRLVHDTPWRIRISPVDGRPEFLPPTRTGSEQAWIRQRPRRE
jgi:hypothetical protein